LKTNAQVIEIPPVWIFEPTFDHYYQLIFHGGGGEVAYAFELWSAYINSIIICLGTTALSIVIGFPAAYSISRYNTGGYGLFSWIFSFRMLPPIVFLIPMFILYQAINLIDTHIGLIIIYLTFNLPLAIFILKSFIDELPKDYEEASMIDGCSRLQSIWKIVLRVSAPGIAAVSIVIFLLSFNEFMFAYVFTTRNAVTLTAKAAIFITEYSWLWAELCTAMMLAIIPMLFFTIIFQEQIIKGLRSGIKG
jgi:multiple sugar transport system permease protein